MRVIAFLGLVLLLSTGCATHRYCDAAQPSESCPPAAPREFRAAWVATVGNIDWPSKPGLSAEQQQHEMRAILDRCRLLNLNAVIFQVRTSCDAMYESPYEPWSYYLTGQQGKPPSPMYDPLKMWVEEAHRRGLELHAWFNPFRARPAAEKRDGKLVPPFELAPSHVANRVPGIVKPYGKHLWLDPGEPAAQDYTLKVMADVVRRYDVDGIHIDDYFYPYREKGDDGKEIPFPDDPSWQRYQATGGTLSRDDWRRENINQLVCRMYAQTKKIKPHVKVGISPFGIWRPGNPEVVKGFDAYHSIYCDSKLWINEGWVDYWTPQLYWKTSAPQQPYEALLRWWVEQNAKGRHVWPGVYTSRIPAKPPEKPTDKQWTPQDILDQIAVDRRTPGVSGEVHFSEICLQRDREGIDAALRNGPYKEQALVPASPWLGDKAPPTPSFAVGRTKDVWGVRWRKGGLFSPPPFLWVVYAKYEKGWKAQVFAGEEKSGTLCNDRDLGRPVAVSVTAVDRLGNESRKVEAVPIR